MDVPANVIVTGAPRSGTSLVAGLFVAAGHDPGPRLIPATPSNPAGFFEDLDVNRVNDDLLDSVAGRPVTGTVAPPRTVRWLGAFSRAVPAAAGEGVDLSSRVPAAPFVLKDPRFAYTLPAWREALGPVCIVVVVRHPSEVLASVTSMVAREPNTFGDFTVSASHLLTMWEAVHRAVLSWADGDTCFVRLVDVHDPAERARLAAFTGVDLQGGGARPDLYREHVRGALPKSTRNLLAVLDRRCGKDGRG